MDVASKQSVRVRICPRFSLLGAGGAGVKAFLGLVHQ